MKTPQDEVKKIHELTSKCEQGLFPFDALAYFVGECVIKYEDPNLLSEVSSKISSLLEGTMTAYEEEGKVLYYSNLGIADHTDFARQLIGVLKPQSKNQRGQV